MYPFPIAAVISCCKFNGLKQHTYIVFLGINSSVRLSGLKSRYGQGCVLSGGFRRKYLPSWEIDGETVETVSAFILGGSKTLQILIAAMKLKDAYSLEGKL